MVGVASRILYVDDDLPNLRLFERTFGDAFDVSCVSSGAEALARLEAESDFAVVVSDHRMPEMTGVQLFEGIAERFADVGRILLTAYSDRELLLSAIQRGQVHDYVLKPWDAADVEIRLRRAVVTHERARAAARAVDEREILQRTLDETVDFRSFVGLDGDLKPLAATLDKVAATDATVMIRGETGTGKELVARRIHAISARASRPLVRLNCSAVPESLLETELFGHEAGAYTGAKGARAGRLEQAHRGTLFLDEVGDLSPAVQVKLLRVVQEREFERVGSNKTLRVDVRLLTATHQDLESKVREGTFREDLFHRLHVVPIRVPPLRERPRDIDRLVTHFLGVFGRRLGKALEIDAAARAALAAYDWPGNVRELANVIERAAVLADRTALLAPADLSFDFAPTPRPPALTVEAQVEQEESSRIRAALVTARGSKAEAARLLGVARTTLNDRIRKLGIR